MNKNLSITATQLAIKFSDEMDIPSRFKKKQNNKKESNKTNLNSHTEQNFRERIQAWLAIIETLLSKVDNSMAWRYITIKPKMESGITSVTRCQDFSDFTDYFILRRDRENCSDIEVGLLAMLYTEFQREIERKMY